MEFRESHNGKCICRGMNHVSTEATTATPLPPTSHEQTHGEEGNSIRKRPFLSDSRVSIASIECRWFRRIRYNCRHQTEKDVRYPVTHRWKNNIRCIVQGGWWMSCPHTMPWHRSCQQCFPHRSLALSSVHYLRSSAVQIPVRLPPSLRAHIITPQALHVPQAHQTRQLLMLPIPCPPPPASQLNLLDQGTWTCTRSITAITPLTISSNIIF